MKPEGGLRPNARDESLDLVRGVALLWVVFIYCIYYTSLVPEHLATAKSYLLIEMPIFFFIAGASARLSRQRGLIEYYASRLSRILIPYWVYACICLPFALVAAGEGPGTYGFSDWLRWLLPYQLPRCDTPFLTWHLWFVRAYLGVAAILPLLAWVRSKLSRLEATNALGEAVAWRRAVAWLPLPVLALLVYSVDTLRHAGYATGELTPYLVFYGFWVYLGLRYVEFRSARPNHLALACGAFLSFAATYGLVRWGGYASDMQVNKFPPNLAFLTLQCGYFCCYAMVWHRVVAWLSSSRLRGLIGVYSRYSYTVYLYHAFTFLGLQSLFRSLGVEDDLMRHPTIGLPLYVGLTLGSGLFWARCFGWVEDRSASVFRGEGVLERMRGNRKLRLAIGILAAVVIFGFFQEAYQIRDVGMQQSGAYYRFNVIFGSDIPRVIDDLTNATADHYRTKVHPLFVLLTNGAGTRLAETLSGPIAAAKMTATAGAASAGLMVAYLLLLGCGLIEAILLSTIFGYSASQMLWSSVPETFVFGTLGLLLVQIVGLGAIKARGWVRWLLLLALPAAGVLALGVTTTNALQAAVVFAAVSWAMLRGDGQQMGRKAGLARRWRGLRRGLAASAWLIVAILITFTASVRLSNIQRELYPSSALFYRAEAYDEEPRFTHWENLREPLATAATLGRTFGMYSFVAPPPNIVTVQEPPDTQAMVFEADCVGRYTPANWAALAIWAALLGYGIYAGCRGQRLALATILLCLMLNLGIHSVYGTDEAFLYSPHLVYLLFGLAGLGLARVRRGPWPWRAGTIGALGFLVWHVTLSNQVFMDRVGLILSSF